MSAPAPPGELARIAEEAARAAAAVLTKHFAAYRDLAVDAKSSPSDLVSIADREAERAITSLISRFRPLDGILGEEQGESSVGSSGYRWVVDPLDGTANFLIGNPQWCVSVGVERDGRGVAGAVLDPLRDELFLADEDGPVTLNHQTVRRPPPRPLSEAVVATGFSYGAARRRAQAQILPGVLAAVADIRRAGAAALDLAWTATGRLDAYYEYDLSPWDVAAGQVLCDRAGLSNVALEPFRVLPAGLLVCDPQLVDELHGLVTRPI